MRFYIPSFYGDIRLEKDGDKSTRVIVEKVTPAEQDALGKLATLAVKKKWLNPSGGGPLNLKTDGETIVKAPLMDVQAALTKLLKPGRTMVTAVKFSDGRVEEVHATPDETKKPVAGTSVAKPTQGCPLPAFEQAEIKARRVLETFLDDEQLDQFRQENAVTCIGALTGHRYIVISRNNTKLLRRFGGRQFYDLDDKVPFCVHDWHVPAAEEMLGLVLLAQLPEHENYLRHLEH